MSNASKTYFDLMEGIHIKMDKWERENEEDRRHVVRAIKDIEEVFREMDEIHEGTMAVLDRIEKYLEGGK